MIFDKEEGTVYQEIAPKAVLKIIGHDFPTVLDADALLIIAAVHLN